MSGVLPASVVKLPLPLVAPGGGTPLWVLRGDRVPSLFCWASSAASNQCTSNAAWGIYSFSFWFFFFFFNPSNFGHVFDSFYLLSHHSSFCTGDTPVIPISRAGLSNHHLKINPVKEVFPSFFFFFFFIFWYHQLLFLCVPAFLHKMAILYMWCLHVAKDGFMIYHVLQQCTATVSWKQITMRLLKITLSDSASSYLVFLRWIFFSGEPQLEHKLFDSCSSA